MRLEKWQPFIFDKITTATAAAAGILSNIQGCHFSNLNVLSSAGLYLKCEGKPYIIFHFKSGNLKNGIKSEINIKTLLKKDGIYTTDKISIKTAQPEFIKILLIAKYRVGNPANITAGNLNPLIRPFLISLQTPYILFQCRKKGLGKFYSF